MADNTQFGSPNPKSRSSQFGDKISPGDTTHCAQCEAMLADALDGTLSAADQALFDAHMAHCSPCAQMLADARRGASWLEMLRAPRPEPPAALLERILSQTSGAQVPSAQTAALAANTAIVAGAPQPALSLSKGLASETWATGHKPVPSNVIPFRTRLTSAIRYSAIGQVMLQPRLAMTAAMAFFSIALTMNLTGVHLQDLRASNLKPSSLKRDFYSANARVVQYYEGLRVVYELESRVHDLQSASDNDTPAGTQTAPAASPSQSTPANPTNQQSNPNQPKPKKPAPNPGTSRRESPAEPHRLLASGRIDSSFIRTTGEGGQA